MNIVAFVFAIIAGGCFAAAAYSRPPAVPLIPLGLLFTVAAWVTQLAITGGTVVHF